MAKTLVCDGDESLVAMRNSIPDEAGQCHTQSQILCGEPAFHGAAQNLPESIAGLGTLGLVISAIEHEINQPLHAIVNFTDASIYVLEESPAGLHPNLLDWLRQISEQANRAAIIIKQARCFVDQAPVKRSAVDINKLVRDCINLVSLNLSRQEVRLRCELNGALPKVGVDAVQILLVLVNLVRSAADALLQNLAADRELLLRTSAVANQVQVSIYNSGCAWAPEDNHNHCESSRNPKTVSPSLGLELSQSIVRAHDGCLWTEPNSGRGPALFLSFPAFKEGTDHV
jgi:C4-dicarboxylate-specific signal transduction histidine kinase